MVTPDNRLHNPTNFSVEFAPQPLHKHIYISSSAGKLNTGSPALNAGVVITDINDGGELDIWGNETDSTPNIGAYQGTWE